VIVYHALNSTLTATDIFKSPISIFIDKPDPTDPNTSPTDINVFLSASEKPRRVLKTGTEAGHAEGSAYATAHLRNLFGGAESLTVNASLGTRTRSAYSAAFETPVLSNPSLRFELAGLQSSALKPWASHEESQRGGAARLRYQEGHLRQELSYSGIWRQVTGLAENASPTVRADAGDSVKSAIAHAWSWDGRDSPILPTRGMFLRTSQEIAGFGPLKGDVAFGKCEVGAQAALPLVAAQAPSSPAPGFQEELPAAASLTASLRAGFMHPLPLGNTGELKPSRISDRFNLGGPTDIRGFRLSGLGPRDGTDAVGGDAYAAGGLSLLLPLPRVKPDTPLRFQAFVNGGRLVAMDDARQNGTSVQGATENIKGAFKQIMDGYPSCSAGVGVVYAHPAARFEVNFSLPLVLREGEEGRKGLQFGVGMSFM
jgi:outer membrane protein insertion porin family